jgi:hypothetical protein
MCPAGDHPAFIAPPQRRVRLWRYTDFTKYVDFLERRALFFSRSDVLGDPYEGSRSHANVTLQAEKYQPPLPETVRKQLSASNVWARQWTFINCWHQNDGESAAMWRLYTRSNEAVAITTTFDQLHEALPEDAFVGSVQYIDYAKDWLPEGNTYFPFIHKRLSFTHEREVRAVIQTMPTDGGRILVGRGNPDVGKLVQVNVETLVNEVLVAPTAPDWFLELVERTTTRCGLKAAVGRSSLDKPPVF